MSDILFATYVALSVTVAGCAADTGRRAVPATGGAGGSSTTTGGNGGTAAGGSGGSSITTGGSGGDYGSGGAGGSSGGSTGDGGSTAGGSTGGGGSASDAGSMFDGGMTSTDGGGGPPSGGNDCASVPTKLCTNFDDQTMGQEPKGSFTVSKGGGYATMLVDSMHAYTGSQSMHIKLINPPDGAHAQLQIAAPVFPFANSTVHGRVMMYLATNYKNHWDLVGSGGLDKFTNEQNAGPQYIFGNYGDHWESVYYTQDASVDSETKTPAGKWVCLQWQFKGGSAFNITLKQDGEYVDKGMMMVKKDWDPPKDFKSMGVGWVHYEGGIKGTVDLWLDDLALGEQEIPCPMSTTAK